MRTKYRPACVRRKNPNVDELVAWARGVAATPSPLVTDHERHLIGLLVMETQASTAQEERDNARCYECGGSGWLSAGNGERVPCDACHGRGCF